MLNRLKILLLFLTLVTSLFLFGGHGSAGTNQIYLSPVNNSVQNGDNVTVALRIDPGSSVNSVQATVNYDQNTLQYVSDSVSAFPSCVTNTGGGGTVTLVCTILGGGTVSSDSLIANITLKALVGSGSSNLTISGANAAGNGSYTNPTTAGGVVAFTTAAEPVGVATPITAAPKKTATTTTPAPAAAPAAGTPKLTTTVKNISYTSATVNVASDLPVQISVNYGTDSKSLSASTPFSSLATTASLKLDPTLIPGTTYYYQVVAKDAAGTVTKDKASSLTTLGFTIHITVLDASYHPLAGKTVTFRSTPVTGKTNSKGVVTFNNVSPGLHHLEYALSKTKTISVPVYVDNNLITKDGVSTAPAQSTPVVLAAYRAGSGSSIWTLAGLVTILVAAAVAVWRRNQVKMLASNLARRIGRHPQSGPPATPSIPLAQPPVAPTPQTPLTTPIASTPPSTSPSQIITPTNPGGSNINTGAPLG